MKKNLKSFIREEDWKTIKKSILISSLWLITWFALTSWVNAWHSNYDNHSSWTWGNYHSSTHSSHNNHSSY
jgi:hypothetical protein